MINPSRTAVLGLHWIYDIMHDEGALGPMFAPEVKRRNVVEQTGKAFAAARAAGVPVVYTRVAFQAGHADLVPNAPLFQAAKEANALVDGTRGTEIIAELRPEPGELVVTNNRVGGFAASSLDLALRSHGIDTVVLTGVATDVTVESTARHAVDVGYRTIILSDCTSTDTEEAHVRALQALTRLTEVMTVDELVQELQESA